MKHSLLAFVGKHSKLTLVVILLITAFFYTTLHFYTSTQITTP